MVNNFDMIEMGRRIKQCRSELKMTQEDLGNALNYTRQKISSMEKGESEATIDDIRRMAKVFKCDIGYLVGEYSEKTRQITDVVSETGLTGEAANELRIAKQQNCYFVIRALNEMLCYDNLRLLDLIGQYVMMDEHETVELNDGERIDKGVLYSRKIEQEMVKLRSGVQQKERGN